MPRPAGSPLWFIYYLKHKQTLLQMSWKEQWMSQREKKSSKLDLSDGQSVQSCMCKWQFVSFKKSLE